MQKKLNKDKKVAFILSEEREVQESFEFLTTKILPHGQKCWR